MVPGTFEADRTLPTKVESGIPAESQPYYISVQGEEDDNAALDRLQGVLSRWSRHSEYRIFFHRNSITSLAAKKRLQEVPA